MPQPLKDFIESGEKELIEKFKPIYLQEKSDMWLNLVSIQDTATGAEQIKQMLQREVHDREELFSSLKSFLSQRTTQTYELGQATALAMVMREIEGMEGLNSLLSRDQALSTLKQKLLTNIK